MFITSVSFYKRRNTNDESLDNFIRKNRTFWNKYGFLGGYGFGLCHSDSNEYNILEYETR